MAAAGTIDTARRRVVVGDADARARGMTARLVERLGFETCEAATGEMALELSRTRRPAAVLLDVALPGISGYQVCQMLREEYGAELPILLLSKDRTEPHDRAAGLLLGADDYIAKPYEPSELMARVTAHTRASLSTVNRGRAANLTPSEHRVLCLLAEGVDTKTIAAKLSITPKTVATHINNAMQKLDVHTRAQAVALAHQLGLVDARAQLSDNETQELHEGAKLG
jgi:DNA-binding NarL/FixJ family response regulator